MLAGLLEKALRETWAGIALACLGLALTMGLFVQVLPQFQEGLNAFILQVPFMRTLISGLMGMDVSDGIAPQMLLVVVWSHPVVLTIVWGFALVLCTRVPAGEIDRGTVDVLLGWPVARGALYASETLLWLGGGAALLGCGFLGYQASALTLEDALRPRLAGTLATLLNLLAVYVAVGGVAQCVSAASSRRGQALGIGVGFLLASFLVQFLSTLWPPAERVVFLSFAHYYQPARVMLQGGVPVGDILVLTSGGAAFWAAGALVWRRRSVLTV